VARRARLLFAVGATLVVGSILLLAGVAPAATPLLSYAVAGGAAPGGNVSVSLSSHRPLPLSVAVSSLSAVALHLDQRPIYLLEDPSLSCSFGSLEDLEALQARLTQQLAQLGGPLPLRIVDGVQLLNVVATTPGAVVLDLECGVLPVSTVDPGGTVFTTWLQDGGVLVWSGGPLGFFHQVVVGPAVANLTYPGWEGQRELVGFNLTDPTPVEYQGPVAEAGDPTGAFPSPLATAMGFQYTGAVYGANVTQLAAHGGTDAGYDAPGATEESGNRTSLAYIPVDSGVVVYFGGALWPFRGPSIPDGGTDLGYDIALALALGVRPTAAVPQLVDLTVPSDGTIIVRLGVPVADPVLLVRVPLVQTTEFLAVVALDRPGPRRRDAPPRPSPPGGGHDPRMLRATFLHLPELGPSEESRLWQLGIRDWETLARRRPEMGFSEAGHAGLARTLAASQRALEEADVAWFASRFPPTELWRLYPAFREQTAFLDIETTSLSPHEGIVTVVAVHGGGTTRSFIADEDLEELPAWLARFKLLVTFNGRYFDVPFLQFRFPALVVPPAHIDLRFVLYRLGIAGGLKRIEQRLGLGDRTGVEGVDGLAAVRLWAQYRAGHRAALDRLVEYNRADTVNLEPLMEFAARELTGRLLDRQGTSVPAAPRGTADTSLSPSS
jgi:uncharacterized protein YprB with RNaseH-like and TPR domain